MPVMRVLKLILALSLSAAICSQLQIPVVYSVIAVFAAWDETGLRTVRKASARILAAISGALFAVLFYYSLGTHPFIYVCIVVGAFAIYQYFFLGSLSILASMTAVAIIPTMFDHHIVEFGLRVMSTFVGIITSSVVNLFIAPARFGSYLQRSSHTMWDECANKSISLLRTYATPMSWFIYTFHRWEFILLHKKISRICRRTAKQREEWQLQPASMQEKRKYLLIEKRFHILWRFSLHMKHLHTYPTRRSSNKHLKILTMQLRTFPSKPGEVHALFSSLAASPGLEPNERETIHACLHELQGLLHLQIKEQARAKCTPDFIKKKSS